MKIVKIDKKYIGQFVGVFGDVTPAKELTIHRDKALHFTRPEIINLKLPKEIAKYVKIEDVDEQEHIQRMEDIGSKQYKVKETDFEPRMKKRKTITLEPANHEFLEDLAKSKNEPFSHLVDKAIAYYRQNYKNKGEIYGI